MGTDTPIAALSDRPRLLFDYFTQLFAQVTNPPLDAIREELVTSLDRRSGPRATCSSPPRVVPPDRAAPRRCSTNEDLAKLILLNERRRVPGFRPSLSTGCSRCHCPTRSPAAARRCAIAIDTSARQVSDAIADGANLIVLSDRDTDAEQAPIPSLLLTGAVHHHLMREKTRTQVGLVVETGDAREVHHMALLIGYGAAAVNPYLALRVARRPGRARGSSTASSPGRPPELHQGRGQGCPEGDVEDGHLDGGLLHRRAGLRGDRPGPDAGRRVLHRHGDPARRASGSTCWPRRSRPPPAGLSDRPEERAHRELEVGGEYQWRREGEYHLFNPKTVFKLQHATRAKRYDIFKEYTAAVDDQAEHLATLRGLLRGPRARADPCRSTRSSRSARS